VHAICCTRLSRKQPWYTDVVATFGLLHGAWHDSSCWEPLTGCLEALGHSAVAPELPLHDPRAGYEQRVQPGIEALAGVDGEVVVVAHSQSSGLGALVAAARPVSMLVYLCPRMGGVELPDGAPTPFREGLRFPPSLPDGTSAWDPDSAREAMYPRLAPERARALVQHLRPMAMPPDDYPLDEHPDVPTALIYAADDELFEPAFERFVAREVLGVDPIEIPGGHFPMVEDPEGLADLFDRLAGRSAN
jgi:pimeloyl-ACP methyl ester carboxylesterase